MAAKQTTLPISQTLDSIIIGELWRSADQQAVAHFLFEFVLCPTVAALAERHFVPLFGLVIIADLCKFLAVPHRFYAVLKDVADVGILESIETAHCDRAVVMNRHRFVKCGTWKSFFLRFHIWKGAILEQKPDADTVHNTA